MGDKAIGLEAPQKEIWYLLYEQNKAAIMSFKSLLLASCIEGIQKDLGHYPEEYDVESWFRVSKKKARHILVGDLGSLSIDDLLGLSIQLGYTVKEEDNKLFLTKGDK